MAPTNPEMSTYYGIIGKDTRLLVLKNVHDRLNAEGIEVSNQRGMKWKTFGDDHLKQAPDSLRIGAFAVFESRRQVMEANRVGNAESAANDDAAADEVLKLLPDKASVDRATAKAVSYIPWAAQSLTELIYRQRGAGALELKERLGPAGTVLAPIIKANIATIADPDARNSCCASKRSHGAEMSDLSSRLSSRSRSSNRCAHRSGVVQSATGVMAAGPEWDRCLVVGTRER